MSTGLIKLPIQKGKAPPQGFTSVQFHELALIDSGLPLSSWHQSISCAACVECNTATGSAGCEPTSTCSPHNPSPCRGQFKRRITLARSTHTHEHVHTRNPSAYIIPTCEWTHKLLEHECPTKGGLDRRPPRLIFYPWAGHWNYHFNQNTVIFLCSIYPGAIFYGNIHYSTTKKSKGKVMGKMVALKFVLDVPLFVRLLKGSK